MSSEGPSADVPTAGGAVRGGDIVCHLGDRLGDSVERIREAGRDACIVVDDHHVVLGRLRGRALGGDPNTPVEDVMRSGPSTIRADIPVETVIKRSTVTSAGCPTGNAVKDFLWGIVGWISPSVTIIASASQRSTDG